MNIQEAIKKLIAKQDLTKEQMHDIMFAIMTGKTTEAQIGGFLIALAIKGESVEEIVAATKIMRSLVSNVDVNTKHLVDTCGTGGDNLGLFNISTASAFVVASAGGKVAKHGNRSISSKSGSADVLEKAGANLNIPINKIASCIEKTGFGFMFAPLHHSAMKYAIKPRREIAVKTIFNILGPLTNPAKVTRQIIGVYNKKLVTIVAKVLQDLGSTHVLVVHSYDGLDEISIAADTFVAELKNKQITTYIINPTHFNLKLGNLKDIKATNAYESLNLIKQALRGENNTAKNIIALNAGAAIYVAGLSASLKNGVNKALNILKTDSSYKKLKSFIKQSNSE